MDIKKVIGDISDNLRQKYPQYDAKWELYLAEYCLKMGTHHYSISELAAHLSRVALPEWVFMVYGEEVE
jgi:hypothetical protein